MFFFTITCNGTEHALFLITELDLFKSPKEMIDYYFNVISNNGTLKDSIDLVRSQTCRKAFDYEFMSVEGKLFVLL